MTLKKEAEEVKEGRKGADEGRNERRRKSTRKERRFFEERK